MIAASRGEAIVRREGISSRIALRNQSGLVLLLSLGLLAGLSLLALLAATSMLQQQQMAANHADGELARLSAMAAAHAGEQWVLGLPDASRAGNCSKNCFLEPASHGFLDAASAPSQPETLPDEWWLQSAQPLQHALEGAEPAPATQLTWHLPGRNPPLFTIRELEFLTPAQPLPEHLPPINGVGYYEVLGRGTGTGIASTHVAEAIVARPWLADSGQAQSDAAGCALFRPWVDCGRMAYRERR